MKKFHTNEVSAPWWYIIPQILTLGLGWGYCLTSHRKYYLNRKLLLNLLNTNQIKLRYIKNLRDNNEYVKADIDVYEFDYNGKEYEIWHWIKSRKFTLGFIHEPSDDQIGLYDGDMISRWQVKQIVKHIENNKVGDSNLFNDFMKNLEEFKNTEIRNDHTFVSPIYTQRHLQES